MDSQPAKFCPACGTPLSFDSNTPPKFCYKCGHKLSVADSTDNHKSESNESTATSASTESNKSTQHDSEAQKKLSLLKKVWLATSVCALLISQLVKMSSKNSFLGQNLFYYLFLPILIGGAYYLFQYIPQKEKTKELLDQGGVYLPRGFSTSEKLDVQTLHTILKDAGFQNIQLINLHDLKIGFLTKPGTVESLRINGREIRGICTGVFKPDVPVIITYHEK